MRHLAIVAALVSVAHAQAPGERPFDTRKAPAFRDARTAFGAYLDVHAPEVRGVQHICVVGFRDASGDQRAWVHWREGREIILWEEAADPAEAAHLLTYSRRSLDLATDAVDNLEDVHGSTYLVTRAWVRKLRLTCEGRGAKYQLRR